MLEWLENTQLSGLIRTEIWGWPLALTLHALGTALVIGLIFVIGLRLLGLFELIRFSSLNRLFPLVWFALALQLVSGFFLWMTKATRYVVDGAFDLKVLLIIGGIVITYNFSKIMEKEAVSWESTGALSARNTRFVAAMLVIWSGVLIAGRLTGYLGAFG